MTQMTVNDRIANSIKRSNYISRDLSWVKFNERVLDQSRNEDRNLFERLKFLAITDSNQDEFFMIRVGSLYNYLDYNKERVDYSGLREGPFKIRLFSDLQVFAKHQNDHFKHHLTPLFEKNGFLVITDLNRLAAREKSRVEEYFMKIIFPMLTPMVFDSYHSFPILMNKVLTLGVITKMPGTKKDNKKLSFVQIPQNLPRFFEVERGDLLLFIPIEEIIRKFIGKLYRNVDIASVSLFRVTRNGDFTLEESDELDANFVEEIKQKLKTRKTGRVVRIEVEEDYSDFLMNQLKDRWELEENNVFVTEKDSLIDYTSLWQIVNHREFRTQLPERVHPVPPLSYNDDSSDNIFELLKEKDVLLHHPYNSIEPLLRLLEKAAEDPGVLSIKLTIYRLAKDSRVTAALQKAAENGKNVSVLFELKARFDEENNIREAKRLQKAGCFVIYGMGSVKTHTKLLLIVRKQGNKVTRYVHIASGNYNEDTAKLYTDIGLLTTDEGYAQDVSEFFNVITGHSNPTKFRNLLTAPRDMRKKFIEMIRNEATNARKGLPSGVVMKMNSLEDKVIIEEMYKASKAGVPIKLIVRGICCLRPGRKGLSENIEVRSIVGEYLEHSRVYYFHNNGDSRIYSGSADMMVRSFDRRVESLFLVLDARLKKQLINLLVFNLRDNVNSYVMQEDGTYEKVEAKGEPPFNVHEEFFRVTHEDLEKAKLF